MKSQGTTASAMLDTPSTSRLVIRIKLPPQQPAPAPARRGSSRNALVLIVGVVVALLLGWLVFTTFGGPRIDVAPVDSAPPPPTPAAESVVSRPPEPEVQPPPDAPTSPIEEVVPTVPKSALDTIRGTIKVSVRVTIDKQGTVVDTAAEERGPSRYFERLAVAAAKKWTFTPVNLEQRRTMLLKFNFTRYGVTAEAAAT